MDGGPDGAAGVRDGRFVGAPVAGPRGGERGRGSAPRSARQRVPVLAPPSAVLPPGLRRAVAALIRLLVHASVA
eukprot:gene9693-7406_t